MELETLKATELYQLTIEEKVEDLEYLFKTIIENHALLEINNKVNGFDWADKKEIYLDKVKKSVDDDEFYWILEAALKDLRNGHTHMLNRNYVEMFRVGYYNIGFTVHFETLNHDKVLKRYNLEKLDSYDEENLNEHKELTIAVDNAQVADVIEGKLGYIYIPSMIQPHERKKDEEIIINYLKTIKDYQALIIDLRGNLGGSPAYWLDFLIPQIIHQQKRFEVYAFMKEGSIFRQLLEINPIDSAGLEKEGIKNLRELNLNRLPKLPTEVKDNFKYYINREYNVSPHKDTISYKGNVYILVDRYTYSAADLLALFAKDTKFAILIGEPTGGGGISDEPWLQMLPNSGYLFRFPLMMGTTSDGTVNEEYKTIPDYEVSFPKRNTNFLYDLCIQKVIQLKGLE